jgi:hypothetical protein
MNAIWHDGPPMIHQLAVLKIMISIVNLIIAIAMLAVHWILERRNKIIKRIAHAMNNLCVGKAQVNKSKTNEIHWQLIDSVFCSRCQEIQ